METRGEHPGVKDVIDRQLALITQKHGANAAKLADALFMSFAANSKNDPYKDVKIAHLLATKVRAGEFMCDTSQGMPSFGWKDKKGKPQWLFRLVQDSVLDLDHLFRPLSHKVRKTSILDSELTDQIIITAGTVHKLLRIGPIYEAKSEEYHDDSEYRRMYGHLTRTAKNVARLLRA